MSPWTYWTELNWILCVSTLYEDSYREKLFTVRLFCLWYFYTCKWMPWNIPTLNPKAVYCCIYSFIHTSNLMDPQTVTFHSFFSTFVATSLIQNLPKGRTLYISVISSFHHISQGHFSHLKTNKTFYEKRLTPPFFFKQVIKANQFYHYLVSGQRWPTTF